MDNFLSQEEIDALLKQGQSDDSNGEENEVVPWAQHLLHYRNY